MILLAGRIGAGGTEGDKAMKLLSYKGFDNVTAQKIICCGKIVSILMRRREHKVSASPQALPVTECWQSTPPLWEIRYSLSFGSLKIS